MVDPADARREPRGHIGNDVVTGESFRGGARCQGQPVLVGLVDVVLEGDLVLGELLAERQAVGDGNQFVVRGVPDEGVRRVVADSLRCVVILRVLDREPEMREIFGLSMLEGDDRVTENRASRLGGRSSLREAPQLLPSCRVGGR